MFFNNLSCYDCDRGEKCVHFNIGIPWKVRESMTLQDSIVLKGQKKVNKTKAADRNVKKNNIDRINTEDHIVPKRFKKRK